MNDISIHDLALCETRRLGSGTSVMAFARLVHDVRVGTLCHVGSHAFLDHKVVVGDRVTISAGAHLSTGVRVEDDVVIGPNVVFAGNGAADAGQSGETLIRAGAFVGANATILGGLTIGSKSRVNAGSVVTRSVPPNAIVTGNPAQIIGYVDAAEPNQVVQGSAKSGVLATSVLGVTLHHMAEVEDLRGNLSVGELGRDVPFEVKRYFLVYDVPNMEIRGEHAHIRCHQFLIAVKGSLHVVVDDGRSRQEVLLDRPSLGLHLPPMTWGIQYRYSADAVLLVLASHHYDAADYIRDHDEFLALVRSAHS